MVFYQKIKNTTLKLSDIKWTCGGCNILHDRDINAALNLKAYYYKKIKIKAITARSKACGPCFSGWPFF